MKSPHEGGDEPRIAPGGWRDVGPDIALLSRIFGWVSGTEPLAVFLTLGRNRRLFWGWLHFAGRLMPGGRLPRRQTELVILRVAATCGSEYELTQHRRIGRRSGLTAEQIALVEAGGLEGWTGSDRVLLAVADELLADEDVTDETWAALREEYGERVAIEIVMLVGHYRMLATALKTLRIRPDRPRR